MCRFLVVVAFLAAALVGCAKKQPVDKVTFVADDDPRMNAAIEKGRSTVNTFIAALTSPKAGQSGFSVKMAFTDGTNTEHMWITPVRYDGTSFQGKVDNIPVAVKTMKTGQKVSVIPSKISD